MLIKKQWNSKKTRTYRSWMYKDPVTEALYTYTGWFLFGIIPVLIIREQN